MDYYLEFIWGVSTFILSCLINFIKSNDNSHIVKHNFNHVLVCNHYNDTSKRPNRFKYMDGGDEIRWPTHNFQHIIRCHGIRGNEKCLHWRTSTHKCQIIYFYFIKLSWKIIQHLLFNLFINVQSRNLLNIHIVTQYVANYEASMSVSTPNMKERLFWFHQTCPTQTPETLHKVIVIYSVC